MKKTLFISTLLILFSTVLLADQKFDDLLAKANKGNADAQNEIGATYINGINGKPDYAQALAWYKKAVAQNHMGAQYNLAGMYLEGKGVKQDAQKAYQLYSQAAKQDLYDAQYKVALMQISGTGTTENKKQGL